MTLCEKCIHEEVCNIRDCHEEGDEIALKYCSNFKNKADFVEVVRCKDCIYFQPDFVLTQDGKRRPYTEEEIQNGKFVTGDVGINCASRCQRFDYWEENRIPVWFDENAFCSYGKRTPKERGGEK